MKFEIPFDENIYRQQIELTYKIAWEKFLENPISIWEFENSYFRFKFYGGDYKINWDNFKYFNVVNQTLFFGFKESGNWYSLSESEIGKESFDKVVDFVAYKIKTSH